MPQKREITSLSNPRVKEVVRLHQARQRRQQNLLIAQTRREVQRAVAAGLKLVWLFHCPDLPNGDEADVQAVLAEAAAGSADRFELYQVSAGVMNKLAPRENPEGLLAVLEPTDRSPEDAPTGPGELWLVAVGLTKPGNLGAIVRSADAAGATGVIACDSVVDVYHPASIRSSTAAVFSLPVYTMSAGQTRSFLASRNVTAFAASPDAKQSYDQADMTGPAAIVIGAEDTGLDESWLKPAADQKDGLRCVPIFIPMRSVAVDSLNASVAAAVLLFEAARQRRQNVK